MADEQGPSISKQAHNFMRFVDNNVVDGIGWLVTLGQVNDSMDRIAAASDTATDKVRALFGVDPVNKGNFSENLAAVKAATEQAERENPKLSTAGKITGFVESLFVGSKLVELFFDGASFLKGAISLGRTATAVKETETVATGGMVPQRVQVAQARDLRDPAAHDVQAEQRAAQAERQAAQQPKLKSEQEQPFQQQQARAQGPRNGRLGRTDEPPEAPPPPRTPFGDGGGPPPSGPFSLANVPGKEARFIKQLAERFSLPEDGVKSAFDTGGKWFRQTVDKFIAGEEGGADSMAVLVKKTFGQDIRPKQLSDILSRATHEEFLEKNALASTYVRTAEGMDANATSYAQRVKELVNEVDPAQKAQLTASKAQSGAQGPQAQGWINALLKAPQNAAKGYYQSLNPYLTATQRTATLGEALGQTVVVGGEGVGLAATAGLPLLIHYADLKSKTTNPNSTAADIQRVEDLKTRMHDQAPPKTEAQKRLDRETDDAAMAAYKEKFALPVPPPH